MPTVTLEDAQARLTELIEQLHQAGDHRPVGDAHDCARRRGDHHDHGWCGTERVGRGCVDGSAEVHADARLVPPVYVGPGAIVESGARVGSLAVLGEGSRLGENAVVENAVVGARATVGAGSVVVGSVIGDDAELGDGCELRNLAVIGPGASRPARRRRPADSGQGAPLLMTEAQ